MQHTLQKYMQISEPALVNVILEPTLTPNAPTCLGGKVGNQAKYGRHFDTRLRKVINTS
jgi:hypothetical protein